MQKNLSKIGQSQEIPRIIVRLSNLSIILGCLGAISVFGIACYKLLKAQDYSNSGFYWLSFFLALIAVISLLVIYRFSDVLKAKCWLVMVSVVVSIYAVEIFLSFSYKPPQAAKLAKKLGLDSDERTKFQVLQDFRDAGIEAYPNVHPSALLNHETKVNGFATNSDTIFPLGGISNQILVQDNENGFWFWYKADQYGFHNPNGMYGLKDPDIAITGDSFAEGRSVKSSENICSRLGEAGYTAINLGKTGFGPLSELATIREYIKPIQPRIILWLYFVNDLKDLALEVRSLPLAEYLRDRDFSQNLRFRQSEIDSALKVYIAEEWVKYEKNLQMHFGKRFTRFIKLYQVRNRLNFVADSQGKSRIQEKQQLSNFEQILFEANDLIREWEGQLYFVYLPSYVQIKTKKPDLFKEEVLRIVTSDLQIPWIDIELEVFEAHPDPISLFPFGKPGHFNEEGYRLVAKAIEKRLKSDGIN